MAQWVNVPVTEADYVTLMSRIHVVGEKNSIHKPWYRHDSQVPTNN